MTQKNKRGTRSVRAISKYWLLYPVEVKKVMVETGIGDAFRELSKVKDGKKSPVFIVEERSTYIPEYRASGLRVRAVVDYHEETEKYGQYILSVRFTPEVGLYKPELIAATLTKSVGQPPVRVLGSFCVSDDDIAVVTPVFVRDHIWPKPQFERATRAQVGQVVTLAFKQSIEEVCDSYPKAAKGYIVRA